MMRVVSAVFIVFVLSACALLQPIDRDNDARRAGKIMLIAYETTQQAMIIYGRLPGCDTEAGVIRFCRNQKIWDRLKVADKVATLAIVEATPVLNGEQIDVGQIIKAMAAIESVKQALKDAQVELGK